MKKPLNVFNYSSVREKEAAKKQKNWLLVIATILIILSFSSCQKETTKSGVQTDNSSLVNHKASIAEASIKVFATGLNNPRGLNWGPDGYLYVAEGGVGGTNSTEGQCTQIPPRMAPTQAAQQGDGYQKSVPLVN